MSNIPTEFQIGPPREEHGLSENSEADSILSTFASAMLEAASVPKGLHYYCFPTFSHD